MLVTVFICFWCRLKSKSHWIIFSGWLHWGRWLGLLLRTVATQPSGKPGLSQFSELSISTLSGNSLHGINQYFNELRHLCPFQLEIVERNILRRLPSLTHLDLRWAGLHWLSQWQWFLVHNCFFIQQYYRDNKISHIDAADSFEEVIKDPKEFVFSSFHSMLLV